MCVCVCVCVCVSVKFLKFCRRVHTERASLQALIQGDVWTALEQKSLIHTLNGLANQPHPLNLLGQCIEQAGFNEELMAGRFAVDPWAKQGPSRGPIPIFRFLLMNCASGLFIPLQSTERVTKTSIGFLPLLTAFIPATSRVANSFNKS